MSRAKGPAASSAPAPLAPLAARFAFNDGFLDKLVEGFGPDDWRHRTGESNHAQWLVGHLAGTRRWMLRLLGADAPEQEWEALFTINTEPGRSSDAVPVEDLRGAFRAAGEDIRARLAGLGPADLHRPIEPRFPYGKTLDDAVHFLHFHETYHLGQIGLLRRGVGKPGVV